jgi:anionic cell wall polymer biosynthesis LytR-Cps2A-Psr (LCP) family protein
MFYFGNRLTNYPIINQELSKYIKESTNKYIENYITNNKYEIKKKNISKLTIPLNNSYLFFTFVSLLSFMVGYNFNNFNLLRKKYI